MQKALVLVLNPFTHDSRVLRQVCSLQAYGLQPNIFALHEDGLAERESSPVGQLRRFKLVSRPWSKHKLVQILKYLECGARMTWAGVRLRPVLVHANDLDTLPIGYSIARLTRARLIYDAHELWSDPAKGSRFSYRLWRCCVQLEKYLARKADAVTTVSDSIANHMGRTLKIPAPTVLRNVAAAIDAGAPTAGGSASRLHELLGLPAAIPMILQVGRLTLGRGLNTLIAAMQTVKPPAVAVLLGEGPSSDVLRQSTKEWKVEGRVFIVPPVPPTEVLRYASGATIGVTLVENTCLSYRYALPNKLFEYVQAGLPVVVSNLPEMSSLVARYQIGETFTPGDPESLASVLNRILYSPDKLLHYRKMVKEAASDLNWEREQLKLFDVYDQLRIRPNEPQKSADFEPLAANARVDEARN